MSTRRAALDGLGQIMDATSLEDLFAGSDEDATFMFDLLAETARGRAAGCYWEVCRTARRRGVSPEYVADRAAVLLASIEERRRSDVYRILGVEPLASDDAIRQRWLDFAKAGHPDLGGDAARFRQVRSAFELLRDPERRAEYERYWLKALGPFERVTPRADDEVAIPVDDAAARRRVVMVARQSPPIPPARSADGAPPPAAAGGADHSPDPAPDLAPPPDVPAGGDFASVMADVRGLVARIEAGEIERLRARLEREMAALETFRDQLAELARLKRLLQR